MLTYRRRRAQSRLANLNRDWKNPEFTRYVY